MMNLDQITAPAPDFADRLAAKVFDRIERDRSLILQNVAQEIREQLILHGPAPGPDAGAVDELVRTAAHMCAEINSHGLHRTVADCFERAYHALSKALERVRP